MAEAGCQRLSGERPRIVRSVAEVARSVAFGANDPGTLSRMPEADDWARASEMKAHLEWPPADAGAGEGSDATAPTT